MTDKLKVLGCIGCGSAIAEAFLTLADIDFELKEVDYATPGPGRSELLSYNPLGQVPTLVFDDGTILTETLAVANFVNDQRPDLGLIPTDPEERTRFFRWSTFIISSIYPCFTYGDEPKKWVSEEHAAALLRQSTDEQLKKLWLVMEKEAGSPYFLGETFSAIDIYLKVMPHWRPGRKWMRANTPKVSAIHDRITAMPVPQKVWNQNFDGSN